MDNVPIILGQYRIEKTLGIGAFGKVKSKSRDEDIESPFKLTSTLITNIGITNQYGHSCNFLYHFSSGTSYYHRAESSC